MTVIIDGVEYVPKTTVGKNDLTVLDVFAPYLGTKEYKGIVEVIQKWYYGSVPQTAWCATAMSWALAQLGLMKKTLGTKQENVYYFEQAMQKQGVTKISGLDQAKSGDIVILNYSTVWKPGSSKHVTAYTGKRDSAGNVYCVGGNQSDHLQESLYKPENIRSIWRPAYGTGGVTNLNHLPKL